VRTRQQQGRGIRFDSHIGLPEELQNVTVQRFISQLPLGARDKFLERLGLNREKGRHATDDYLRLMSARKDMLNQQFLDLLQDVGSEGHPSPKQHSGIVAVPPKAQASVEQAAAPQPQAVRGPMQRLYDMIFGRQKQGSGEFNYASIPSLSTGMGELDEAGPVTQPTSLTDSMNFRTSARPGDFLAQLKQIKEYSDRRQWSKKHAMLRDMMTQYPYQWAISEDPTVPRHLVGVQHWPTGFRYHMPRQHIPSEIYADLQARSQSASNVA
jgi:hypothetical protein